MVSKEKLKDPVFLFNAFLLVAFLILNFIANGYAEEARKFPKFVLGIGIIVLIFWMVIYFAFPKVMQFIEAQEEIEEGGSLEPGRFYRVWLSIAIAILTGYLFGFLFIVPAAFLSYGLLLGERGKMISLMIIMVITTMIFYVGFDYVLNIPLLKGVFLSR
jgi:MFS family permease